MPRIMTLPKLGVNMVEATIVRWLVNEGDSIEKEQSILEAETDKSSQEIPATASGILARILVHRGDTVQCQQPIAVLVEKGEELPRNFSVPAFSPAAETPVDAPSTDVKGASEDSKANPRVKISPLAKKIARELNIDFTKIPAVRPDGRVEKEDILAFAADVGEQIVVRPRFCLTLAFDHRLVDGAPAARFLRRIKELVEEPKELMR